MLLRKQIPINTNQWEEWRPGYLEADTVAHCGDSVMGMFAYAYTVNFTDIATGPDRTKSRLGQRGKRCAGANRRRRKNASVSSTRL